MNLNHLKYAVEVSRTHSINKAAENLYMGQPNLSRAIKELEESVGIKIFERNAKGITPTKKGAKFLEEAMKILSEMEELENFGKESSEKKQKFSVSAPRASYVSSAFAEFAKKIDAASSAELYYKESNSITAITNILQSDYKLGIIRYQTVFDRYFKSMLKEKGLESQLISEFSNVAIMSKSNPLATRETIDYSDLRDGIEIIYADPYVPSLPFADAMKAELSEKTDKRIFVYERASKFDLLRAVPNTFMFGSPLPKSMLEDYGLAQVKSRQSNKTYMDLLIYKKGYELSKIDKIFISELYKARADVALERSINNEFTEV